MSPNLRYGPNTHLPWGTNIIAALQLLAASISSIVAPPILIASDLSLPSETTSFLVSTALLCSGIATFIQVKRIGRVGTGLLVIEGLNITFVGVIIAAGLKLIEQKMATGVSLGMAQEQTLGTIFTCLMLASVVATLFAMLLKYFRKFLPPLVLGLMLALTGLCLLKVGAFALLGGEEALEGGILASPKMLITGLSVFVFIGICQFSRLRFLSMASVLWGIIGGTGVGILLNTVPTVSLGSTSLISIPFPFAFGFGFDLPFFMSMSLLSILLVFCASGIITGTCQTYGIAVDSKSFEHHLQGGVLAQSINSIISAAFCACPVTPYALTNSVISLNGIGSRQVGYTAAILLIISSFFPVVSHVFMLIPQPIWGALTLFLFGSIALSGFELMLSKPLGSKDIFIASTSLSAGLAVEFYPEIWSQCAPFLASFFSSGIIFGSSVAVFLQIILSCGNKRT